MRNCTPPPRAPANLPGPPIFRTSSGIHVDRAARAAATRPSPPRPPSMGRMSSAPACRLTCSTARPWSTSTSAWAVKRDHRTPEGLPAHSFSVLLAELVTLARNRVVPAGSNERAAFELLPQPTALQGRAFELIGVFPRADVGRTPHSDGPGLFSATPESRCEFGSCGDPKRGRYQPDPQLGFPSS